MRIDDVAQLSERAYALFRDVTRMRLWRKERFLEQVRHSRHPIDIPPSMIGRARPIYSGMGGEVIDRAKALLRDPVGVRLDVAQVGISRQAELQRERVQAWLTGALQRTLFYGERTIEEMVLEDLLLRSRAYVRVLPNPGAWAALLAGGDVAEAIARALPADLSTDDVVGEPCAEPEPESESEQESKPELEAEEGSETEREPVLADEGEGEAEDEGEDVAALIDAIEDELARARRRFEELRRRVFPIAVQWVPARSVIDLWDMDGLAEVYELQLLPVYHVLRDFRDADGKPLARELARSVDPEKLTESDYAVVLIRADREHIQIALVDWGVDVLWGEEMPLTQRRVVARPELLWQGPHGMGAVPYAVFRGRTTTAAEPALYYRGFLDDAAKLIVRLDEILTQRHSSARWGAWPQLYIKKTLPTSGAVAAALGGGDAQTAFEVREGGVAESLGPGEELVRVPWFDPEAQRILDQTEAQLRTDIMRHTLGPGAYGQVPAQSGYQQALLETAAAIHLEPFRRGAEAGYARLAELLIRAARALLRQGLPDIPVRYATPDGASYVTLNRALADQEWTISASIVTKPVGGDLALYQAIAFAEDRGYITHEEALRRIGDPYPQRTIAQRYAEQVLLSPAVIQAAQQEVLKRALAALGQGAVMGLPGQPIVPQALAQAMASLPSAQLPPELLARLPQPGVNSALLARGPAGPMGGIAGGTATGAGLANLAAPLAGFAGIPPAPQMRPGARVPPASPAVVGQAQAAPGGAMRQRDIAARGLGR